MKTAILIAALVLGAVNVSAKESSGQTEMNYPGGKKKKRGFNYRQHRHWVKGYPKCRMN